MISPEHLIKLANQKMPYGKYKGWLLMDIPEEYLIWLSYRAWPAGELGELLALLMDIKTHGDIEVLKPLSGDHSEG